LQLLHFAAGYRILHELYAIPSTRNVTHSL
jgi:hypothetical protein